ncbi:MAG: hypothetical protein ABID87_06085 [Chloroflexota bacterium]
MPSVFKGLASITAWVLFIFGAVSLLGGFGRIFMSAPLDLITAYFSFGVGGLFLSVVVMKLRHMME